MTKQGHEWAIDFHVLYQFYPVNVVSYCSVPANSSKMLLLDFFRNSESSPEYFIFRNC